MRILAIILCVILIAFSFFMCHQEYTHAIYEVTITESLKYNYSVGNEWRIDYICDGKGIENGEKWIVPLDTTKVIEIRITVTEIDDWSDINHGTLTVILKDNFESSTNITVTENMGRFKGNTAQWKITCKVRLVGKSVQK